MKNTLTFNAADYPEPVLRLILAEAEKQKCPPGEALRGLINKMAEKVEFEGAERRHKEAA